MVKKKEMKNLFVKMAVIKKANLKIMQQTEKGQIIIQMVIQNMKQWKHDFRNGKGIEYYSNGNVKYEGNWIDNKFVGK